MSFGGGFGSNTGGGFGGFGSTNNTNTNATSGSSLFGGNTATSGGFGGFGSNNATNNSPFGAPKTGFGAPATTSSGGLFGSGTSTTGGFGGSGFGANNNTSGGATLSTGFGASNSNSLFGANKSSTGFGATNNTGSSLFGGNNSGGFGSTTNNTTPSNPFGASSSTTTGGFGAGNTNNSFGGFSGAAASNTNQGTAATPFAPFTEKDGGTANTSSAYQSITMQQPYQGKSFEELRLEDYAQNRRLPQNNSFGSSSTFGGFGSNANNNNNQPRPGLFGATNNSNTTSAGFGGTNAPSGFGASNTGFGANNNNSGSSLFAAKPAGGGLFGNNNANTASTGGFGASANTGSSLFGGNNNNAATNTSTGFGGGFGATNNNNTTTSNSLFGGNNANNQAKSAFGGFGGNNNTNTNTNTGFGGFGGNNNTATSQPSAGLFGSQPSATAGFGSNTGSSLFGGANNQPKPAGTGLFGAPANSTGGGLFGNTNNNSTGGGFGASTGGSTLFGGGNNQPAANTGGGLFGGNNNQPKPATGLFGAAPAATTGGGLFGGTNNTGGGLFGGNNTANAGNSLFGGDQNKPATSSLFGGNTGGSSLFGGNNNNNNQAGSGMFGGNTAPAGNSLFGGSTNQQNNSMFGASQGQAQQNQLTASITGDPYGNAQLFASLAGPSPPVGPLATPLSGAKAAPRARASLLASVRGGSPMLGASTSLTPRARPGYGFSYSNYNSPAASTPSLTPGASSLLRPTGSLGSTLSSRLSKSFSTSNLRADSADGPSLVRTPVPGQGSLLLGSGSLGSGSVRRLKIDRSLRSDLFGEVKKPAESEPEQPKRVSFDKSAEKDNSTTPKASASNALTVRDDATQTPEMSQVSNAPSLTTVQEEGPADNAPATRKPVEAGDYYTEPPLKQIKSMSRSQLSNLKSFIVGRQGVGKIEFGRTTGVDLSTVALDDICGKIVQLKTRSATVYEDDADKPPVGRGLNVPSTIYLEQSWSRASRHSSATAQKSSQKDIDKHKARLKRVGGTKFLDYDDNTGIWSFTVEHFTTYELDDEDETTMHDTTTMSDVQQAQPASARSASSGVSDVPAGNRSFGSDVSGLESPDLGEQDDTFQFKIAKRSQQSNLSLPGGFEDSMPNITHDNDDASADEMQEDEFVQTADPADADMSDPFIEAATAVQPPSPDTLARYGRSVDDEQMEDGQDLPGAYHNDGEGLKSILKPSNFNESLFGATENLADLPWEDQLQRTLSPKKRDRQALRDAQNAYAKETQPAPDSLLRRSLLTRSQLGQSYLATKSAKKQEASKLEQRPTKAFTTSMDIMKSLFEDENRASRRGGLSGQAHKAISQSHTSNNDAKEIDQQFRSSFKPSFTRNETLVFASGAPPKHLHKATTPLQPIVGGQHDITFYRAQVDEDLNPPALKQIQQDPNNTLIEGVDMDMDDDEDEGPSMPTALTSNRIMFRDVAESVQAASEAAKHEKAIWSLCSVLFDPLEICAADIIRGMDDGTVDEFQSRIRKDAFLAMWDDLLTEPTRKQLRVAKTAEERAMLFLTLGDVNSASETLMKAKNPRLAVLIAQLPCGSSDRNMIKNQITAWQDLKDWSEFSDGQRALYSLLAGNTCSVAGNKAAPEDSVAGFQLAENFKLSWQQCLALRIRYAEFEGFTQGVAAFVSDVDAGVESVSTTPWHGKGNTDTLLSLLKIVTDQATPDSLLDPLAVSGDASHNRFTWQLATLLGARGILQPTDDQMDALTMNLATEQESAGVYTDALWTLLHLNDNDTRFAAIKAVLERNSAAISDPSGEDQRGVFEVLTQDLMIPASMVWSAKALYAQGILHDHHRQCEDLLAAATAESFQEAHNVLCSKIGPSAIIEQHYDELLALLQQFEEVGPVHFDDWATGGQIYLDLCQLLQLPASRSHGREAEALLKKLDRGLERLAAKGDAAASLEMRVARIEIRKMVDDKVKHIEDADRWFSGGDDDIAHNNKGVVLLENYMRALGEVH